MIRHHSEQTSISFVFIYLVLLKLIGDNEEEQARHTMYRLASTYKVCFQDYFYFSKETDNSDQCKNLF